MPKASLRDLVERAQVIPCFNFYTFGQLKGILRAIREIGSPVLVGISKRCWDATDKNVITWYVRELIPELSDGFGYAHLDHGWSVQAVREAINMGFKSVMFDGSMMPLDQNIKTTLEALRLCESSGVMLEGEVGYVGRKGVTSTPTEPKDAVEFCKSVAVDYLAISIGTFHGVETKDLDFSTAKDIWQRTGQRLALHGGSGVRDEDLLNAKSNGFVKFNFATGVDKTELKVYRECNFSDAGFNALQIQELVVEAVRSYCLQKYRIIA